jgi:hypothetical protein
MERDDNVLAIPGESELFSHAINVAELAHTMRHLQVPEPNPITFIMRPITSMEDSESERAGLPIG